MIIDTRTLQRAPAIPWYRRPATWTWLGFGLVMALYATLAWQHRWITDDGLIVLRTVRQILDGNGPVFNIGERVEVNTSPMWTAILCVLGMIPGVPLEWISLFSGLLCALGGVFLALDGTRRLYRLNGFTGLMPAGVLVVCALTPFRDFATSGLETGLILLWLGGLWWLLVRYVSEPFAKGWPVAVVVGLGTLVRPDLALISAVAFVALVLLASPGWRRAAGWFAAAAALPAAYQVFRMGYYGLLVPNTAVVKEASTSNWDRGWGYLANLLTPQALWAPLLGLLVLGALMVRACHVNRMVAVLTLMPLVAAAILTVYVVRVGGDFMHGRMLLPALFCLLLPVLAVPVTRLTAIPALAVLAWGVVAADWLRPPIAMPGWITDERAYWVEATGNPHPMFARDYLGYPSVRGGVEAATAADQPVVLVEDLSTHQWYSAPAAQPTTSIRVTTLGATGMLVPLDVRVHDAYGLANPIAAHSAAIPKGRTGHQKWLTPEWELADSARAPVPTIGPFAAAEIDRVQVVLSCPAVRELLASARDPLTPGRLWDNFAGSFTRGGLRYSRIPAQAVTCASG